jgi:hypothetical protein
MIELQPFASGDSRRRADQAVTAADGAGDWLWQVRRTTAKNYSNIDRAAEAIARVNAAETLDGYVISIDDKPVGLATVIRQLRIWHPERRLRTLTGREIDYWTDEGVSEADHTEIVEGLARMGEYTGTALGMLTPGETEHASGIPAVMEPVGKPGAVRVPPFNRAYLLPTITEPLQVYATTVTRA